MLESAPSGGVCSGGLLQGWGVWSWGGVCSRGGLLWGVSASDMPPPINRITDTSKHNLGHNFVAAGNYGMHAHIRQGGNRPRGCLKMLHRCSLFSKAVSVSFAHVIGMGSVTFLLFTIARKVTIVTFLLVMNDKKVTKRPQKGHNCHLLPVMNDKKVTIVTFL